MVKLSKKHEFILYSLMKYLEKLNKKFSDQPLEASVSKIQFINLLKDLEIVEKTERGLYKNLQVLEKKKLILYENRFLKLTEKGYKLITEKEKELFPYLKLIVTLRTKAEKSKSAQTYFK